MLADIWKPKENKYVLEGNDMDLYIYGAGKREIHYGELLREKHIPFKGFIDRKAYEGIEAIDGYPIISYEEFIKKTGEKEVIISMIDTDIRSEVEKQLLNDNIPIILIADLLEKEKDMVARNRNLAADYHISKMEDYFDNAEKDLEVFWNEKSYFRKYFDQLDLENVVELACGRGRHVPQYIEKAGHITLVDILEKNIEFCKERFGSLNKVSYYVNNGYDLQQIPDGSQTSLFSYDAVVHFEMMDVFNYLKETKRILKAGGLALFHHSNNTESYKVSFETGKSGRSYMSAQLFAHLCNRAELEVVEQNVIDWGNYKNLDCITLVRKKS